MDHYNYYINTLQHDFSDNGGSSQAKQPTGHRVMNTAAQRILTLFASLLNLVYASQIDLMLSNNSD